MMMGIYQDRVANTLVRCSWTLLGGMGKQENPCLSVDRRYFWTPSLSFAFPSM